MPAKCKTVWWSYTESYHILEYTKIFEKDVLATLVPKLLHGEPIKCNKNGVYKYIAY